MDMKNKLIIVVLIAGLGLIGLQQASATGRDGGGYGADCSCKGYGAGYPQLDEVTKAKVDTFRADTKALRKQIVMKRAERKALMSSQTPDATAVAKVAGELFDLKAEMSEKANAAGLPALGERGPMDSDSGKGKKGRRQPPCLNQQGRN